MSNLSLANRAPRSQSAPPPRSPTAPHRMAKPKRAASSLLPVVGRIAEYLDAQDERSTLARLALASRDAYCAARTPLYRSFTVRATHEAFFAGLVEHGPGSEGEQHDDGRLFDLSPRGEARRKWAALAQARRVTFDVLPLHADVPDRDAPPNTSDPVLTARSGFMELLQTPAHPLRHAMALCLGPTAVAQLAALCPYPPTLEAHPAPLALFAALAPRHVCCAFPAVPFRDDKLARRGRQDGALRTTLLDDNWHATLHIEDMLRRWPGVVSLGCHDVAHQRVPCLRPAPGPAEPSRVRVGFVAGPVAPPPAPRGSSRRRRAQQIKNCVKYATGFAAGGALPSFELHHAGDYVHHRPDVAHRFWQTLPPPPASDARRALDPRIRAGRVAVPDDFVYVLSPADKMTNAALVQASFAQWVQHRSLSRQPPFALDAAPDAADVLRSVTFVGPDDAPTREPCEACGRRF